MAYNEKCLNNLKSYKPLDQLTPEEREKQLANAKKGGLKTQEIYKKAKSWKDVCNQALITKVSRDKAVKYLGDDVDLLVFDDDGMVTMQDILTVRAMQIASDGNIKGLEFIRDTSGQKPVEKSAMDISADIMTAADRALLENINARMAAIDGLNAKTDPVE